MVTTLALALLTACGSSGEQPSELTRLWIESELVPCEGVGPMECMQVATSADGVPELFYDEIDGFDYVEGSSYVIDVRITDIPSPPADGSSKRYELVEIIEQGQ